METYYFFYSAKQRAVTLGLVARKLRPKTINHVVDSQGNIHEYTLMSLSKEPNVGFDDVVFLCEGTKACVISGGFPQGHWAKEHMHKFNSGNFNKGT